MLPATTDRYVPILLTATCPSPRGEKVHMGILAETLSVYGLAGLYFTVTCPS